MGIVSVGNLVVVAQDDETGIDAYRKNREHGRQTLAAELFFMSGLL